MTQLSIRQQYEIDRFVNAGEGPGFDGRLENNELRLFVDLMEVAEQAGESFFVNDSSISYLARRELAENSGSLQYWRGFDCGNGGPVRRDFSVGLMAIDLNGNSDGLVTMNEVAAYNAMLGSNFGIGTDELLVWARSVCGESAVNLPPTDMETPPEHIRIMMCDRIGHIPMAN